MSILVICCFSYVVLPCTNFCVFALHCDWFMNVGVHNSYERQSMLKLFSFIGDKNYNFIWLNTSALTLHVINITIVRIHWLSKSQYSFFENLLLGYIGKKDDDLIRFAGDEILVPRAKELTLNVIVRLSIYIWALRIQGMSANYEGFCRVHDSLEETT
ncbi:hypothetical protein ACJX0J_007544, partial [Zea mays]